jgi:hypothetical protein
MYQFGHIHHHMLGKLPLFDILFNTGDSFAHAAAVHLSIEKTDRWHIVIHAAPPAVH